MLIGIIAEYNPFHNGHKYQLDYIREHYSPDSIVVAMSGSYVQRGEPAAFCKYVRTEAALKNGADIVFELPQIYATSSAPDFAAGGVKLLAALGCNAIACGAEDPEYDSLPALLDIAADESDKFRQLLSDGIKTGMTYPAARTRALSSLLPGAGVDDFLCKPNNLLAFEYSLAARTYAPNIRIIMLPRKGAGHDDDFATGEFASASHLRNLLAKGDRESLAEFYSLIPANTRPLYNTADFLCWRDFDTLLYSRLLDHAQMQHDEKGDSPIPSDLSKRIINNIDGYRGASDFISLIKTKNITYTAASRALLCIMLGHNKKNDVSGPLPYIRVLGMKKGADKPLSSISSHLSSSGSELIATLPQEPSLALAQHIKNDMLYEGIRAIRSGTPIRNEYKRRFLVVE